MTTPKLFVNPPPVLRQTLAKSPTLKVFRPTAWNSALVFTAPASITAKSLAPHLKTSRQTKQMQDVWESRAVCPSKKFTGAKDKSRPTALLHHQHACDVKLFRVHRSCLFSRWTTASRAPSVALFFFFSPPFFEGLNRTTVVSLLVCVFWWHVILK